MNNYTLIFETKAGSHLYGTNIPTSDLDYRGVVYEPLTAILGIQPFEQKEFPKPEDKVYYGLRKFVSLALQCNPNIIELLFAGDESITYKTEDWDYLVAYRDLFLNKHAIVKNFCGYALGQFKRMETHHRWMTGNTPTKPNPEDYGRVLNDDGSESWTYFHLKNEYENKKKNWDTYSAWLANRNKIRHDLEEKFGYDTKHGMHLVRLLQQGEELLKTGHLILPRPNAKELLEIRYGSMTYEQIDDYLTEKMEYLRNLEKSSNLPASSNYAKIEEMVMQLNYDYVKREF
jgi:predicted nucleotidyltransferase